MQPLEKLKTKHDHTLTDWLKFGIFSIMMMAPFAAIASKCVYASCNKNAYKSYYGETINEEEQIKKEYTELIPNNEYLLTNELLTGYYETTAQTRLNLEVKTIQGITYTEEQIQQMKSMAIYVNSSNIPRLYFYDANNIAIGNVIDLNTKNVIINFVFKSWTSTQNNLTLINDLNFYYINYNKYSYIDNVFYYAVNQLNDEDLFNWTKDTAIYSTINNMCQGLTIQNGALPLLLTYWTFITLIYIVFDLIIGIFTKLTHLLK